MSDNQCNAKPHNENDKAGRLAGTGAGVVAGAQLGTFLVPIPVIGTFTGALVGGLVGSKIGKRFGGALLDKVETACADDSTAGQSSTLAQQLQKLTDLRNSGVLSEEEFIAAKAKLLGI